MEGVATLDGVATGGRADALRRLGLQVHPLEHLPLAFVAGTPPQLQQAVRSGAAVDVYPNERLRYFSAESVQAMSVEPLQAQGLTGKGIGVAIVDSGIDATHPDLAHRVAHNFKVVNGDYFGPPAWLHPPAPVSPTPNVSPASCMAGGSGATRAADDRISLSGCSADALLAGFRAPGSLGGGPCGSHSMTGGPWHHD